MNWNSIRRRRLQTIVWSESLFPGKAEAGARTIYDFVSTKLNEKSALAPAPKTAAGKTADTKVLPVSNVDHGTLTPTDLNPAWHGRVPLPPVRRDVRASF